MTVKSPNDYIEKIMSFSWFLFVNWENCLSLEEKSLIGIKIAG